jgi:hypothetical protein
MLVLLVLPICSARVLPTLAANRPAGQHLSPFGFDFK